MKTEDNNESVTEETVTIETEKYYLVCKDTNNNIAFIGKDKLEDIHALIVQAKLSHNSYKIIKGTIL